MSWAAIRSAVWLALGAAELAVDVYDAGRKLVRRVRSKPAPPTPLSYKDVEHIQAQIRSATSQGVHTGKKP